MSWFSLDAVKDFAERVNVKELAEKVQGALPNLEQTTSILEKLTLTTPELQEERQRLEREEQRKLQVRDTLAGLLPWETRDSERDILVDECKEAILKLSHDKNTFFGPYPIPTSTVRNLEEPTLEEAEEGIKTASHYHQQPSPESLEKLAKLEPLPILLQDFDLNAHVGLINRLLKVDKKLVEMQSTHSGKERMLKMQSFTQEKACNSNCLFSDPLYHLSQVVVNASGCSGGIIFSIAHIRGMKLVLASMRYGRTIHQFSTMLQPPRQS